MWNIRPCLLIEAAKGQSIPLMFSLMRSGMSRLLPLLLTLALAACQQSGDSLKTADLAPAPTTEESAVPPAPPADDLSRDSLGPQLIKRGRLRFRSDDLPGTYARIRGLLTRYDAYLAEEEQRSYGQSQAWELLIRVPSQHFDSLLSAIGQGVAFFEQRAVSVEDVTEQFVDLSIRLRNKKAVEARYRELLAQANSVSEVLAVEKQLAELREDIEATEGRLRYLRNQVSYSTLRVTFYEREVAQRSFFAQVGEALGDGWGLFLAFLVGLMRLWPFWLLIGVVLALWLRWRRRRKERKST